MTARSMLFGWAPVLIYMAMLSACGASSANRPVPTEQGMSLQEAQQIIAAFEARQRERTADDPLRQPKSLEDVMSILRCDQLDLFGAGVEYAARHKGLEALVLHAQIELAWGGGQDLLAYLLGNLSRVLSGTARTLELEADAGTLTPEEEEQLAALRVSIEEMTQNAIALRRVAQTHSIAGSDLARVIMQKYPEEYTGYRVAADYFRSRGDWDTFAKMVAKIEATNPQSNGLIFLRGVAAAQRDGDPQKAAALFREALARDPQFTRAQAHLLLVQTTATGTWAELRKLRAMNPEHPIVLWAGPAVEKAYASEKSGS